MTQILIIDDEEKLLKLLTRIISLEGFEVVQASDCKTALKKLEQNDIEVVLSDVKLPDGNGVELTQKIKDKFPYIEIILMTAYGNIPDGVQAIKNGAFDYLVKGDDNNKIIPLLSRAVEKVALTRRVKQLEKQLDDKYSFANIIGKSNSILQAIELAKKVSKTNTTVLLNGETGTGKEVFAQAIHQASPRVHKNFVAINCSAFGKDLLESEMFGHKAGAFTGANKDKKGLLEEAHLGTIFLDEIGEMSLELQAKLLRVLETGEFIKVGETKISKTDVRIIAATHKDLKTEILSGHFREDLFYRLSVFQIILPPLRERIIDIELLAKHFVSMLSIKMGKKNMGITVECMEVLKQHEWKGNIRELRNIIERSMIVSETNEITINDLPIDFQQYINFETKFGNPFDLAFAEKLHIQKVLQYTNGNKTKAADLLNIALTTLYRKLEE